MKYLTGIHALNLECKLDTCGDWHTSALRWIDLTIGDTDKSVFGYYGIEYNRKIPEHKEEYAVANHLRALLDLMEMGRFSVVQGMKEDFICNDKYTKELFDKVLMLKANRDWNKISEVMEKEYKLEWLDFIRGEI